MRIISILILVTTSLFAVGLPRTLGGVAPGENVEAYVGILGYPSTQISMGMVQIWSWGEGLLVKINRDKTVTEVMITRPGKQKELGFDIGDRLVTAVEKLGKSDSATNLANGSVQTYRDAQSGLILTLTLNETTSIEKIALASGKQTR